MLIVTRDGDLTTPLRSPADAEGLFRALGSLPLSPGSAPARDVRRAWGCFTWNVRSRWHRWRQWSYGGTRPTRFSVRA